MPATPNRPRDSKLKSHTEYMEALLDVLNKCPVGLNDEGERLNDICDICHRKIQAKLETAYTSLLSSIKRVEGNGDLARPNLEAVHGFESMLEIAVRKSPTAALTQIEGALGDKRDWAYHKTYHDYFLALDDIRGYLMDLPQIRCH